MCGIFGILTKKPKIFDYTTFTTLGIANDSRGGDSCGIFIDGKYDYGVKDEKLFSSFFLNNKLLDETWDTETKIALGHCRKASVGGVSKETAQPVVITDKAGNVRFVLIHNGTIHNYKELAEKYIPGVKIDGMTDSQVMARIFYYKGYDCLAEYNGGAVFFIVDYRQPEPLRLVFKGASKKTEYTKDATEERPLFYKCDEDELVFSSIYIWLEALRPCSKIYSLTPNVIWKFTGSKLVHYKTISRDKMTQDKKYKTYGTTVYGGSHYGTYGDYSGYGGSFSAQSYTSVYLGSDKTTNTYSEDGKKAHGKVSINYLGKIGSAPKHSLSKYDDYEDVYFYNGIALGNQKWFRVLDKFRKRLKMSEEEFVKNYQMLIRYLSLDRLLFEGDKLLEVKGPDEIVPYTGEFQMLGTQWCRRYEDGKPLGTEFHKDYDSIFKRITENSSLELSIKDIKSICRQLLMK